MRMIYYELLKLVRNRAVVYALWVLLLVNAACTMYSASAAGGNGYSSAQAAAEAEAWSAMPAVEALADVKRAGAAYLEQIRKGIPITEEDYVRGMILSAEKVRLEQLAGYREYLDGICASANAMDQIGFFGDLDSFTRRTAEKTKKVYKKLIGRELTSDYPDGINLIINQWQTQAILSLSGLVFALLIFLQDQDSGMLPLLFSKSAGKRRTMFAKIASLWIVSIWICLLFYASNFLLAWKLVGFGDLQRPLQTLTGFYTSPLEISVGMYLLLFLVFLILAQAVVGTVFGCLCVLMKNGKLAAVVIGTVYAAELLLAGYNTGWLKYFNMVTLKDPNAFFNDYVCVSLFGMPFSSVLVGIFAFFVLTVGSIFCIAGCSAVRKPVPLTVFCLKKFKFKRIGKRRRQIICSLTGKEAWKLLYHRGGVYMALALLAGQLLFWGSRNFFITPDVFYYRSYAAEFSGVVSERTGVLIKEEEERLDTSGEEARLAQALQNGTLTQDEYDAAKDRIQIDGFQLKAFARIKNQYESVKKLAVDIPSIELLDWTGWSILLGKDGVASNLLCLILVLACEILLYSGYGVYERITGVDLLITASYIGHRVVYRKKKLAVIGQSVVFAAVGLLPRWIRIAAYYGLDGSKAPAASLILRVIPEFFTMIWLFVLFVVLFFGLCILAGVLIWKISARCNSVYGAIFLSTSCFLLPAAALLLFCM